MTFSPVSVILYTTKGEREVKEKRKRKIKKEQKGLDKPNQISYNKTIKNKEETEMKKSTKTTIISITIIAAAVIVPVVFSIVVGTSSLPDWAKYLLLK